MREVNTANAAPKRLRQRPQTPRQPPAALAGSSHYGMDAGGQAAVLYGRLLRYATGGAGRPCGVSREADRRPAGPDARADLRAVVREGVRDPGSQHSQRVQSLLEAHREVGGRADPANQDE